MIDNPTPEEIAQFEKDNPGIVAEETQTKPLPQWPIRVGLILIPLLCFWEWAWFKKAAPKLPKDT